MKQPAFFFVLIVLVLLAGSSCQRELSSNILDTTITNNVSLLKKIKIHHPSSTDPLDLILSLQYDTANRRLNFYLDDTTTANSFDLLAVSYQFDTDGYLAKCDAIHDLNSNVLYPDFTITRNSNRQIQKIVEFDAQELNGIPYNDTVHYSYEQSGTQTIVQDSVRFHSNNYFITRRTIYNAQNKPVSQYYPGSFYPDQTNYSYTNGRLSLITSPHDTTSFIYDNTPISNDWQNLPLLLLGKDYYILQQPAMTGRLNYMFLTFIMEPDFETLYNPLLTQPLSRITVRGNPIFGQGNFLNKTLNFTNTYNTDKLPSTISILSSTDDPFYYTFEYK